MRLCELVLENFRKFEHCLLTFDPKVHITCFVGPNTIGKTNILEGIYYLSLLKSFRASETKDLLHWKSTHFSLQGTFSGSEIHSLHTITVFRPKKQKRHLINEIDTPITEYVGKVPVVFFSPDDINLLLLSPASRRRYLDVLLSQTDQSYLRALVSYQRILKQRNALLKQIGSKTAHEQELDYWDHELAAAGWEIHTKRRSVLSYFNTLLDQTYRKISGGDSAGFLLHHIPSLKHCENQEQYRDELLARRNKDIMLETSSFGPHRDDFSFLLGEKTIETFASRGDTRSMILALKLSEIHFIEETCSRSPLLLLDDVFSELDEIRQEELLTSIPAHIQTFITSTTSAIGSLHRRKKEISFIDMEQIGESVVY